MDTTRDINALQELPEGPTTGLNYGDWQDFTYQVNVNDCYYTCNVTQINQA
jgi:hypothetical protein